MKRFLAGWLRRLADVIDPPALPPRTWWQDASIRFASEPRGRISGGCTACWKTGICGCTISRPFNY